MKIGIVSTSTIIPWFFDSLKDYPDVSVSAIYSRTYEKAKPVAEKYNIPKIYTNETELYQDPDIDTVYLLSPNALHYPQAKAALSYGKNVINEKPFCATLRQAEELFDLAEKNHVFLFDMSISREYGHFQLIQKHLCDLGRVHLFKANLSKYSRRYDAFLSGETPNVFSVEMEGGALMDMNVYSIALSTLLFGSPEQVLYAANVERGIDTSGELILKYNGMLAELCVSKCTTAPNTILLQGEKGSLCIQKTMSREGDKVILTKQNTEQTEFTAASSIQNMERIITCLRDHDESIYRKEKETVLTIVRILEEARKCAGISLPSDKAE